MAKGRVKKAAVLLGGLVLYGHSTVNVLTGLTAGWVHTRHGSTRFADEQTAFLMSFVPALVIFLLGSIFAVLWFRHRLTGGHRRMQQNPQSLGDILGRALSNKSKTGD